VRLVDEGGTPVKRKMIVRSWSLIADL